MPTFCIQCAMEDLLAGRPITMFEESMHEHLHTVHPDPFVTQQRRKELERLLAEKFPNGIDPRRI